MSNFEMIAKKPYQEEPGGGLVPTSVLKLKGVREVRSFGLVSYQATITVGDLGSMFGAQTQLPDGVSKKKRPLAESDDDEEMDYSDVSIPKSVRAQHLVKNMQRGWNPQRIANVGLIAKYCSAGVDSTEPCDVVHLPEFTVYSPAPVNFEPYAGTNFGDLSLPHFMSSPLMLLDGMTRGVALAQLLTKYGEKVMYEEVPIRIVAGIPPEAAKQIFVDMNTTAVPVPFEEVAAKDTRRPAFRLSVEVARLLGAKTGVAYKFVQAALLGPKGETAKAEPTIQDGDVAAVRDELLGVIDIFRQTMGAHWGDADQVLNSGYGPVAIGRLYFDIKHPAKGTVLSADEAMRTFKKLMFERVAKMSWSRSSKAVQDAGFASAGTGKDGGKLKNEIASYPKIRRFSQYVREELQGPTELAAAASSAASG